MQLQQQHRGLSAGVLGGDEFVVMLEDLSGNLLEAANQAEAVEEKIMRALNPPIARDRPRNC